MLATVYNNAVIALHDLGKADEAVDAFLEASAVTDRSYGTFDAAYASAVRRTLTCPVPFARRHRLHRLIELLRTTAPVAGDVAECGCYRGLSSYMICSALREERSSFDGDGFHLFDSLQGLSEPAAEDRIPAG